MDNEKETNSTAPMENNKNKKGLFSKISKNFAEGAKFVGSKLSGAASSIGGKLSEAASSIKDGIESAKAEKELEQSIVNIFNASAQKFTMVVPGDKTKYIKLYAQINYNERTLTIYGDRKNLSSNVYFVDEIGQKFVVTLLRLHQTINITLNNVVYPKDVSVVEYTLYSDAETKKEMQTIINNNQINIIDSTITKSDIG